jgi:MerR family redox-sensitive transcriptional activator SoxR
MSWAKRRTIRCRPSGFWGDQNELHQNVAVPPLTISEVARQIGLESSVIRNYEPIGLLPPAQRISGQRPYDSTVLHRLAIVQRAGQLGFTLQEIRQSFLGFRNVTRASDRWQKLSQRKLAELNVLMDGIRTVRRLLKKMMQDCRCETSDQCGKGIFRNTYGNVMTKSLPANHGYNNDITNKFAIRI